MYHAKFKMELLKRDTFKLYEDIFILMTKIKTLRYIKDTIAIYPWVRKRVYNLVIKKKGK